MGEHLYTYINPVNEKHISEILSLLSSGGVIALPMGTSWAFCCDASSNKGLRKMRLLRPDHPKTQPFSLICSDISMAATMADIGNRSYRILKKIFPGSFTIIVKSGKMLPKKLKDKRAKVGIRIPDEPITLEIIRRFRQPLAATSVPTKNGSPLLMGYQVFENHGNGVDLVVDIGDELQGLDTTVIDLTGSDIEIVREGAGDISLLQ